MTSASPYAAPSDLVTLAEAAALFEETGHPVETRTLKRWCRKHHVIVVQRRGCGDAASWSDLLEVHAREVDRRGGGR
jgi:hypothetical protein